MSILTLRVTGEKGPPPKLSNLNGPNLKEIIKECCNGCEIQSDMKDDIENLMAVETVEKQLANLKVLLAKLSLMEDEGELIFKLCSKIYFSVDPKSPIRSGLVRLLNGASSNNTCTEEKIISELRNGLSMTVSSQLKQHAFQTNDATELISKLSSLYENFPLGASAISSCSEEVIDCICCYLSRCQAILESSDLSPSARQDVCNCIHASVRLGVQMLQNSQINLNRSQVTEMCSKVDTLLDFSILPLDTTRNCGLLIVLCHKFVSGRDACVQLFDDVICSHNDLKIITICTGLLTGLPVEDLSTDNCLLFQKIFLTLRNIYERNLAVCTMLLCLTRALFSYSRALLSYPRAIFCVPDLLQFLISFTWTHLDHHMDSVCHLSNTILINIIKLGSETEKSIKELGILQSLLELTIKTDVWKKAKHASLISLAGVIPTSDILSADPNLVVTLLGILQQSTVPSYAVNSIEQLMLQHLREVELITWTSVWLDPLLASMEEEVSQSEPFGLKQLLTKAVRLSPQIVSYVLSSKKRNWSVSLSCLQACRKWGLKISSEDVSDKWRGLAEYSFLEEAICNKRSQVRLSCFTLLVDCKKTTELLTREELLLLKSFFEFNISENNIAARHQMLRVIGKLLTRIKDSLQAYVKSSKNKVAPEKIELVEKDYNTFCEWLVQFCFTNLFPGASLHRRSTVLSILQMILKSNLWSETANTKANSKLLLLSLTDTYEENKTMASELIVSMPAHIFGFDKQDCVKEIFEECLRLASSYRPPESVTAAYLLATMVKCPEAGKHLAFITKKPSISVMGSVYCTISSIMDKLHEELKIAKKDLLEAASSGPLYGNLFLIRHLLEQIDFSHLGNSEEWRALIGRLLKLCFECSEAVASIVNSDSPEGHLPMDFDYDLSALSEGVNYDTVKVTAQMVLLCSWRTVKEASLILGHLAKHATISCGRSEGLLSEDELSSIGDHLTKLLCETKHRGAFEQAYVGFCKLASRLWSFRDGSLHMIPRKWLEETIEEISTDSKLCATRRSAGIPFMIQALVCTELSVGGGACFSTCMEKLLHLAASKECSVETRTHSLNILRALFRNSQLGEAVSLYVQDSFIIAITGFKSNAWPERNSATLLLTALMTRVFGVPRSKGTVLSWKNRMTGRIFFQRYPLLFGFLLEELQSSEVLDCQLKPTLYPALLLLSRLYPSSLEGTDSNLKLDAFIPVVTSCAGASVMKTRLLSARAVVSLVTPDIFCQHLQNLFCQIFNCSQDNLTHGLLLQAIELLRSIPPLTGSDEENLKLESEKWSKKIFAILERESLRNSPIVCSAYIEVLSLLHGKYYMYNNEQWLNLQILIINQLFSRSIHPVGENDFAINATNFLLRTMLINVNHSEKQKAEDIISFLVKLFDHKLYEIKNKALDFILDLLKCNTSNDRDNDTISGATSELLKNAVLDSEVLSKKLSTHFLKPDIHPYDFLKVIDVVSVHPKVISDLIKESEGVNLILELCKSNHEPTACLGLECLLQALQFLGIDSETDLLCHNLGSVCDIIVENSTAESNIDYRIIIAKWFDSQSFVDILKLSQLSHLNRLRLWNSLLTLCCDEEIEVHAALFTTYCQVKAIHIFLNKFISEEMNDIVKLAGLISWTVGTFNFEILDNAQEEKAFDSGELNETFEEPVLSKIAAEYLQNFLNSNKSLIKIEIPEEFSQWISDACGLSTLKTAKRYCDIGTLLENAISLKSSKLGTNYCNFLKPGFKTIVLSQVKLNNFPQTS